ncbi:ABC transporter substrate-binding protein [Streptomyces sp. NBC_01187]|uniref:ABC transporter substrate-binding protein n=1 Tax=Streptomyces sp. NBC_01187 TaxID=2903766 RepID=UPI0038667AD7|nr:ABC transporter substrate-binding protein [Streptomyces sp. NBC_01187]
MRDVGIDRRALLRRVGGIAAGVATTSLTACETGADRDSTGTKGAKGSKTLVVRDAGGTYGAANRKAVYDPFTKETGIRIKVVNPLYEEMLAQIKKGRPRFDVMDTNMADLARFHQEDAIEELDYDRLKHAKDAGIAESLLTSYGLGKNYWASVMAYRTDAFGGKKPETWADFWDTKAFRGSRALQGSVDFPELEFALLADGVPLHKLYPLDVDRAFKALDEIKGSVRTFWEDGAVPGELLDRKEVVASRVWNGRLQDLIQRGAPLAYQWNGARRQSNGYGIPKGAENPDAAYRLIDFALRPEVQANTAKIYPQGPVVPIAYTNLSENDATNLASTPGHLASSFDLDVEWWLKNKDTVTKRWRKWMRA